MMYQEEENAGNVYRMQYRQGLESLLAGLQADAEEKRNALHPELLGNPDAFRQRVRQTFGWPLTQLHLPARQIKTVLAAKEDGIDIFRVQLEVQPDLWMYGIFFRRNGDTPAPAVIAQHGGLGTPEMVSSFFDSDNYHNMARRILAQGVHVFCPQLLLWDSKRFSQGGADMRNDLDSHLKQVGSSITALEIDGLQKCIDYLCQQPCVDAQRIGMIGLSYGGFFTLHTAALDKRIKAALCSCFFNDRIRYNWYDWVWQNSANVFLDAEIAALVCPRKLWIHVTQQDHLFALDTAQREFSRLQSLCDWEGLRFESSLGDHEFSGIDDGITFVVDALKEV